jgi:hypothetical protein
MDRHNQLLDAGGGEADLVLALADAVEDGRGGGQARQQR